MNPTDLPPGLAGFVAAVMAIVASIAGGLHWWGKHRRTSAGIEADIALRDTDRHAALSTAQMIAMIQEQLRDCRAELVNLHERMDLERRGRWDAEEALKRLQIDLAALRRELDDERAQRVAAEMREEVLRARVETLEAEMRRRGIEVPA